MTGPLFRRNRYCNFALFDIFCSVGITHAEHFRCWTDEWYRLRDRLNVSGTACANELSSQHLPIGSCVSQQLMSLDICSCALMIMNNPNSGIGAVYKCIRSCATGILWQQLPGQQTWAEAINWLSYEYRTLFTRMLFRILNHSGSAFQNSILSTIIHRVPTMCGHSRWLLWRWILLRRN